MSDPRDIIKAELLRRKREKEERRLHDPLTYYTQDPIEHYVDQEKGCTYRLGPGRTALKCMLDTARYRMITSGNRGGKTVALLGETGSYLRNLHPSRPWTIPPRGLVLITSRQQAKAVWADRLLERSKFYGPAEQYPLLPEWCLAKKKSTRRTRPRPDIDYIYMGSQRVPFRLGLENGAELFFYWSGANDAWTRIEGMDFDFVVMDETIKESPTGGQLLPELKMRLLDAQNHPQKPHAGWLFWGATDTKGNSEWAEFKELCQSDYPHASYYRIEIDENPAIPAEARLEMAQTMGEEDQKVRIFGTGGYTDRFLVLARHFDEERNVAKTPYSPNDTDNLFIFLDPAFGKTGSKHGIVLAAISADDPHQIKIIAEDAQKNLSVMEQVGIIREMLVSCRRHSLEAVVIDPSASKTESTGDSVMSQYGKYIRQAGIKMHRGILKGRNRKDDTYPMLISAMREGRLLINPECSLLIKQINEARSKDPTKYSGPMGVVDKKLDVLVAVRYGVSRNLSYIDRGPQHMTPPKVVHDPLDLKFEITEDLEPEIAMHYQRLRKSAQMVRKRFRGRRSTHLQYRRMR